VDGVGVGAASWGGAGSRGLKVVRSRTAVAARRSRATPVRTELRIVIVYLFATSAS
jgi:hypothetical protein